MSRLGAMLVLMGGLATGCMGQVAKHCTGCEVVREAQRPAPAPVQAGGRTLVVLVHGAFGFGGEWDPIVAALRSAHQPFVVFAWRGPFHDLTGTVTELSGVVQGALDQSPELTDVLILAHSAGGPLATRAVLKLRVSEGRQVRLAEIDSPTFMKGRPFFRQRLNSLPPMPAGVERTVYVARRPPRPPATDATRVYLGPVGHNPAVALVGLPLIADLGARAESPTRKAILARGERPDERAERRSP